jgi:glycosyltransferase involved in cell wall biosynthesis
VTATTSVVVGPEQHGVVRHALAIAAATGARVARRDDVAACLADPPDGSAVHHWHFTDRLFGRTVDDAAAAFRAATGVVAGRHVVTLHDVPAATDGDRDRRRAAAYRRVAACCDAVVVASEHERRRLAAADVARDVDVIPLPFLAPPPPSPERRARTRERGRTVGILGFIHPGKGHADVIAGAGALPDDVRLVALGRPSDGHDDLAATLQRAARDAHRELVVTGFLADDELAVALDDVDVPVVPAADVSASASLGTWIAAGRRPLVVANDFAREVDAMGPGLVTLYEPAGLGRALGAALADPASTRRSCAVPGRLGLAAVAAAHVALYRRVAA